MTQQIQTWGEPDLAEASRKTYFGLAFAYLAGKDPSGISLNDVPAPSGHLP